MLRLNLLDIHFFALCKGVHFESFVVKLFRDNFNKQIKKMGDGI